MIRTGRLILAASMLMAGTAALLAGDTPAAKAFKDFGDFQVGGVWHSTDAKGNKSEERFEWLLDKSFLRTTATWPDGTFQMIFGIDPATGRLTSWGFDDKGRVWKGVVESKKAGEWTYIESGHGKNGPLSFKGTAVKLGADTRRDEVQDFTLDGKKQPLSEPRIWTRKR